MDSQRHATLATRALLQAAKTLGWTFDPETTQGGFESFSEEPLIMDLEPMNSIDQAEIGGERAGQGGSGVGNDGKFTLELQPGLDIAGSCPAPFQSIRLEYILPTPGVGAVHNQVCGVNFAELPKLVPVNLVTIERAGQGWSGLGNDREFTLELKPGHDKTDSCPAPFQSIRLEYTLPTSDVRAVHNQVRGVNFAELPKLVPVNLVSTNVYELVPAPFLNPNNVQPVQAEPENRKKAKPMTGPQTLQLDALKERSCVSEEKNRQLKKCLEDFEITLSSAGENWHAMFHHVKIPCPTARTYAAIFDKHHLTMRFLEYIDAPFLERLGITSVGDVAKIASFAKYVSTEGNRILMAEAAARR